MAYVHCPACGWTGDVTDTVPSWPITCREIDEPFPLCPCCSTPVEDAEMCRWCGEPVAWCECKEEDDDWYKASELASGSSKLHSLHRLDKL